MNKKVIKDVCEALIERDGKFLVAKRRKKDSFGGLWEFPGGSLEIGETKKGCLKREIEEELGIDVEVEKLLSTFEDEIPTLKINLYFFKCEIKSGVPRPIDCQDIAWVNLEDLRKLDLAQADKKILRWLEQNRRRI